MGLFGVSVQVCEDLSRRYFLRGQVMIQEGKRAVVRAAKQAETTAPVRACTAGTVAAHTKAVRSAAVPQAECHTVRAAVVPFAETKELSVSRAETVRTVPCQTETLCTRKADYRQGSGDWSLQNLFQG